MFCYQCQEALHNTGCTTKGVCGKNDATANLQDVLVYVTKGLAAVTQQAQELGIPCDAQQRAIQEALFVTVTNVNFDEDAVYAWIARIVELRDALAQQVVAAGGTIGDHGAIRWKGSKADALALAPTVGVLAEPNEDIRSLIELVVYGLKGVAAYAHHAAVLGHRDPEVDAFLVTALAATLTQKSADEWTAMVLETGKIAVSTMALLDKANTSTYGDPEMTTVSLAAKDRPGILISGHDLRDLEQLLEQTKGQGVDVYTHGEMLPAHYYPAFKKYDHLVGHYGGAWYDQKKDFAAFNGPILMTTNCLVKPKDDYVNRLYTTGVVGYPGVAHIPDPDQPGAPKDFSAIIAQAKTCPPPTKLEDGHIVGGFAHNQVLALADKVVDAVKSGAIRKFVVMAGCDGRQSEREYFTQVAEKLPKDTVILTAGCAKFRYNKLPLGDIGGIPRVLDAGQCNDSYSLAVVALKLKEVFGLDDINELPIAYDIAWYEQKAVAVLLALLYLGVKGIRLGPTLPAFISENVANVLVEKFGIAPIGTPDEDIAQMVG